MMIQSDELIFFKMVIAPPSSIKNQSQIGSSQFRLLGFGDRENSLMYIYWAFTSYQQGVLDHVYFALR